MTLLKQTTPARLAAAGLAVIMATVVAGCGSNSASSTSTTDTAKKTITMGVVPGWTSDIAAMHLYKAVLEPKGYTVNIKELSEISTVYAGAAKGDLDIFSSPNERIQKPYWDEYKDKLEDLGTYYANNTLFLAVPDYMTDVQSISDLPAHAAELEGKIIGIEPGSGMTKITQEKVIPDYGLDGFKLQVSSTAAMLTELKKATDAKKPVVVSLWQPFWANAAFPVRALKDPKGAFGPAEGIHTIARKGFSADHPDVAAMMSNFKLTDEQYGTLEDTMVNKYPKGKEQEAIKAWLDQNPEVAPALEKHLKG